MPSNIRIIDHRQEVKRMLNEKMPKILTSLGLVMVETVINYMERNYGRRIFDTGTLIRSITFDVDLSKKTVIVGTNIDYAIFVHNGTRRMRARPFLFDAISENIEVWKEIVQEELGRGWNITLTS